jgi:hypothetical protein
MTLVCDSAEDSNMKLVVNKCAWVVWILSLPPLARAYLLFPCISREACIMTARSPGISTACVAKHKHNSHVTVRGNGQCADHVIQKAFASLTVLLFTISRPSFCIVIYFYLVCVNLRPTGVSYRVRAYLRYFRVLGFAVGNHGEATFTTKITPGQQDW